MQQDGLSFKKYHFCALNKNKIGEINPSVNSNTNWDFFSFDDNLGEHKNIKEYFVLKI
jgi:hypothetical protein